MSAATISLKRPVSHGEDTITELVLEEPSASVLIDCGYPFTLSSDGASITPNANACLKIGAQLAGQPPSVLKKLCLADANAVIQTVLGFFGDPAEGGTI